jgi:23S rRNA pseudouridine1911/1915/1917 synthase
MEPYILYENSEILILFKPCYWSCRTTNKSLNKIKEYPKDNKYILLYLKFIIKNYFNSLNSIGRYGIMNRLDNETSGAIIVAKNKIGFDRLFDIIHVKREITKIYICLTNSGNLIEKEGFIKEKIVTKKIKKGKIQFIKSFIITKKNNKKNSCSYYYKISDFFDKNNNKYTLFYVVIFTGKTHQIRIHMNSIGYPIVSDNSYSSPELCKKNKNIINRLFLHNIFYQFYYNNENIKCIVPIENDLVECLTHLIPATNKKIDLYKIPSKLMKINCSL